MITKSELELMIFKREQMIEREQRIIQKHLDNGDVVTAFKYERVIFGHRLVKFAYKEILNGTYKDVM